jgi:Uma2 family endonuclease
LPGWNAIIMVKTPSHPKLPPIPPLENGDRLTRPEFERRYNAMPHLRKAELIEGVVYMPAALRFRSHGRPHAVLMAWLTDYWLATPGTELGDNSTVRLDLDNAPQPDIALFLDPEVGGQVQISDDDYIEGAPELIVEVAASSAAYDLGDKKKAYRRNGVQEYLVWQMFENKLDWFILQEGEYVSLTPDEDGILRSRIFPGLWLAVNDLLNGNMVRVLAVLQEGLASPEHTAFVQQLSKSKSDNLR